MKKLLLSLSVLSLVSLNAGCHTVQGAGKDITSVGEKSQRAIDPEGQKPVDAMK